MDMVQLLIECGADLTHNPEELLCGSLRSQDLTLFSFLVDVGVRIPATQRDICRLFLHLVDRDEPNVLPILKRMGMDLKQYGGEALRTARRGAVRDVRGLVAPDPAVHLHAVAHLPAEELPDRHAEPLAFDVPQRDVESGEGGLGGFVSGGFVGQLGRSMRLCLKA